MRTAWLPFEWIVALRFLREGRLQTLFIISGIAIGVAVIVFMSALLAGLQGNFIRRVLSAQSHIQLLLPQQVTRPLRGAAPGSSVTSVLAQKFGCPVVQLAQVPQNTDRPEITWSPGFR